MLFQDRSDAGRRLGEHLKGCVSAPAIVLGIPRGGVLVAVQVAAALGAPLDVIVPRKIGAPDEPEFAIGALALAGDEQIALIDEASVARLGVTPEYLEQEIERQRREIVRRERAYREGRGVLELAGRSVVLVDDGIATGLTARAAARAVVRRGPREVWVAVPVAPPETLADFSREGLRIEALATPALFMAVGQFYRDFHSVEDGEVLAALRGAAPPLC